MTETQYMVAWVAYALGGIGCLLGLWLLIRRWPVRLKRFLMVLLSVLFFVPGSVNPETVWLGPAFFVSLFDGLTYGPEAMMRTGVWIVGPVAALASLVALCWPVKNSL